MNAAFGDMYNRTDLTPYLLSQADATPDALCVVYFEEAYHRALVKQFPTAFNAEKASVYLMDNGRHAMVTLSRVFHMPIQYSKAPPRVMHFNLDGLDRFTESGFRNYIFRVWVRNLCSVRIRRVNNFVPTSYTVAP